MKLSERRAQAVVDYLAAKGVAQGRMKAMAWVSPSRLPRTTPKQVGQRTVV